MSYPHKKTQKHYALNLLPQTLVIYLLSIYQVTLVLSKLSPLGFVKTTKLCFVAKKNCCFNSSKKSFQKGVHSNKIKGNFSAVLLTESKPAMTLVNHVSEHNIGKKLMLCRIFFLIVGSWWPCNGEIIRSLHGLHAEVNCYTFKPSV